MNANKSTLGYAAERRRERSAPGVTLNGRTNFMEPKKKRIGKAGRGFAPRSVIPPRPTLKQWKEICKLMGVNCGRETLIWVLESHKRICNRLQDCVQQYQLGLGGEHVDVLCVEEIHRLRSANVLAENELLEYCPAKQKLIILQRIKEAYIRRQDFVSAARIRDVMKVV